MKKPPFITTTILIALLASLAVPLVAQEPTDSEKEKYLKLIEEMKDTIEGGMSSNNIRALQAFQSAVSSPKGILAFYLDCTKAVDFDEEGKEDAIWRVWKEQNEERIKETSHLKALQYQLRYLILSIQATSGDDPNATLKKVMPDLFSYLSDLSENYEDIADHAGMLGRSVLGSVFAKKMKLNVTIDQKRPWVFTPFSVSEIYDQSILPFYRTLEDHANIQSAWDKRILHEGKLFAANVGRGSGSDIANRLRSMKRSRVTDRDRERAEKEEAERQLETAMKDFRTERLPSLQWGKYRDDLLFGSNKGAALSKLLSHTKANLDHKQARAWLDEVSNFINADIYDAESYYRKKDEEELNR